ncbi:MULTISPECIES: DUF4307 domain-containing protein [unclassified Streptomyces]|uniref:DUF4307 domain-containing protein n=1 Tax=unclassified Streptomyces TaxID=2593676 RepID=UPI001586FB0D|nr:MULTISPECIES: DUF4307 domain-containing protein [unclassified Streptomyces]NUV66545.1 DUF4307 domain-containing protein [Streptomyces sp. CAI-121]NUV98505.1 DUF4307 domain-containing protein [Streptomyces sp. CAI 127]NUW11773.1 DUF4307 domain-containing protein [Streptomyces sp. CAI-68]
MTTVREAAPEGRYGRTEDQRADRKLKIVGSVLGVALLGVIGWIGYDYVGNQGISGEMIKFKVVSDTRADVHLEVRKDREGHGYCVVRALSEDGSEVGRKEIRFDRAEDRIDEVVTVVTRSRATAVEPMGCTADDGPRD